MDVQKIKQKKNHSGKVIRLFTVEIEDAATAPELYANPSNPYCELSDEEREKEFFSIFALLLAETIRQDIQDTNKKV